jgi:hypothetical protein
MYRGSTVSCKKVELDKTKPYKTATEYILSHHSLIDTPLHRQLHKHITHAVHALVYINGIDSLSKKVLYTFYSLSLVLDRIWPEVQHNYTIKIHCVVTVCLNVLLQEVIWLLLTITHTATNNWRMPSIRDIHIYMCTLSTEYTNTKSSASRNSQW